jgi:hypothetical protein
MATLRSPDHPELWLVEPYKTNGTTPMWTRGRPDGPPLWIVVHDMESAETDRTAEALAAYTARGADGRSVSTHYAVDSDSVVQCVRLGDVAWTVGNRPGNYRGINWELAGYARQSRAEWLDDFGRRMFAQMAPYVRADAARYGIPLRQLSDAQVKAYTPGITSHAQLGRVFGGSDHTDPGPNFPWDVFMQVITEGEADDVTVIAKYGEKGDAVLRCQNKLLQVDPNCLPKFGADGGYGDETAAAVKAKLGAGDGRSYNTGDEALLNTVLLQRSGAGGGLTVAEVEAIAERVAEDEIDQILVEVTPGTVTLKATE